MIWQVAVVFGFLPIIGQALQIGDKCTNQRDQKATCTNISSCKAAIDAVAVANVSKLYAMGQICGYDINPLVCCITLADFEEISNTIPPGVANSTAFVDLLISNNPLHSNDKFRIAFELPTDINNVNETKFQISLNLSSNESSEHPEEEVCLTTESLEVSTLPSDASRAGVKGPTSEVLNPSVVPSHGTGEPDSITFPEESTGSAITESYIGDNSITHPESTEDTSDEDYNCCDCSDDPARCKSTQSASSSTKSPEVFPESTKVPEVNPLQLLNNFSESFQGSDSSTLAQESDSSGSTVASPALVSALLENIFSTVPEASTEPTQPSAAPNVTQFWETFFTSPSGVSTESPQISVVPDLQSNVEESNPNFSTISKVTLVSVSGEVFTSAPDFSTESSSVKDVTTPTTSTTSTTSKPSIIPDVLPLQSNETLESSTEDSSEFYGTPVIPDYYPEHSIINEEIPIQMFVQEVLPGRDVCGFQLERKRMPNAIIASIDEFPWVALLRYQDAYGHDLGFKCVGTLITDRYVITSSLCTTVGPENFQLKSVRLGEWSISNPTDCVFDHKKMVCPDKFVDIGIEKKIPHPNHSSDLALLRMERNVDFTDFVRPICLPVENLRVPSDGTKLITSGWGASEAGCLLDVKSKIRLPVLPKEECPKSIFRDMTVYEDQICVNASSWNKVCKTDTGGPVMEWHTAHQDRWYLEGVIPKRFNCDNHGFRGVYTRVTKYIPWIASTIREDSSHEDHSQEHHSNERNSHEDNSHEHHSQE